MLEHHLGLVATLVDPLFVRLLHVAELFREAAVAKKRTEMLVFRWFLLYPHQKTKNLNCEFDEVSLGRFERLYKKIIGPTVPQKWIQNKVSLFILPQQVILPIHQHVQVHEQALLFDFHLSTLKQLEVQRP